MPNSVQTKLADLSTTDELPIIDDYIVYEKIRSAKKPRSHVPGDLPCRLVQEFGPELAKPAEIIFRKILKTGEWPKQWRTEYGTPIQKKENPFDESEIRIISLQIFSARFLKSLSLIGY